MRTIPRYVWIDLNLEDPTRRRDTSMCFYLGKGIEETRRILDGYSPFELSEVREIAPLSGYNPELHEVCLS